MTTEAPCGDGGALGPPASLSYNVENSRAGQPAAHLGLHGQDLDLVIYATEISKHIYYCSTAWPGPSNTSTVSFPGPDGWGI